MTRQSVIFFVDCFFVSFYFHYFHLDVERRRETVASPSSSADAKRQKAKHENEIKRRKSRDWRRSFHRAKRFTRIFGLSRNSQKGGNFPFASRKNITECNLIITFVFAIISFHSRARERASFPRRRQFLILFLSRRTKRNAIRFFDGHSANSPFQLFNLRRFYL